MKIWHKLLISSILGMTIGFLLPQSESVIEALAWLEKFALGIGRYVVIPVLIFSLIMAIYHLRMENKFWTMILKNFLLIIVFSVFVIFSGIIVTIIVSPDRIPIETIEQQEIISLNIAESILELFPYNMFSVLASSGVYLFPFFVLAFFVGMGLTHDRNISRPVVTLMDSLSRVFYNVAIFFLDILGLILITLAAFWAVRFNELLQAKVYKDLIIMLGAFSVVLCFIVIPLFLYFLNPKINPWKVLYGFLAPAIASFFSGDINFSIPVLQRHSKENFGIQRRSNALSISLFAMFCRCGSAVVAAAAFIVIIKSYSYLRIGTFDLITIGLYTLAISFALARHPGDGAYFALAALCLIYGGGEYKTAYLIMRPIAFYLIAVGAFIDIMLNAFGTYILARTNGYAGEEKTAEDFI